MLSAGRTIGVGIPDEDGAKNEQALFRNIPMKLKSSRHGMVVNARLKQVLVESRKKRSGKLNEAKHEAELGHAEPLATNVARPDEAAARPHRNDQLRQQQRAVTLRIGEHNMPIVTSAIETGMIFPAPSRSNKAPLRN